MSLGRASRLPPDRVASDRAHHPRYPRRGRAPHRPAAWVLAALIAGGLGVVGGCRSEDPTSADSGWGGAPAQDPVPSVRRSEIGAGCSVKNDCAEGSSCIRGVCQPVSFPLSASSKECFQIDCAVAEDCCGEGGTTAVPEQCRHRGAKCLATLPGCVARPCTRSSDCGGGGVCTGSCAVSSGECTGGSDCLANVCIAGRCSLDFTACRTDADCVPNTCVMGSCACENPSFDPADPVCSDPDCEGQCLWSCEESRCVLPSECASDDDCFGVTPHCVDGTCAECTSERDCSFDKTCIDGRCETRCENDTHCPLFEACHAGECVYVGCRSDRECTLIPAVELLGYAQGLDPRLLRCNTERGIGRCIIPCQTDAQCPPTEVCEGGACRYIGCEEDAECKTITGLHDQTRSPEQPWIPRVECRPSSARR